MVQGPGRPIPATLKVLSFETYCFSVINVRLTCPETGFTGEFDYPFRRQGWRLTLDDFDEPGGYEHFLMTFLPLSLL